MDKITPAQVDQAFARWIRALEEVQLVEPDRKWVLQHGSATNGRPWAWYEENSNGGLSEPPIGSSYLGWTAREAYDQLLDRTTVVWDVVGHYTRKG